MAQSVLFETLPYTSKKHIFRNRQETANSNVLVFKNSRIGIGTLEPEENYRVTITGNTVIRGTLTADILSFTASNQNHIAIDNLGTKEALNIVQRGYDPFITMRKDDINILNIIDGNGNIGIGTSIAYDKLVVNGKIVVDDILLTSESVYQKKLQVPPVRETFIVNEQADIDFTVSTLGLYAASNDDVEVFLNGYKLAYYNSNLRDYTISFSNDYESKMSYFNVNLASVVRYNDIVDVVVWPTSLDQIQEGGTLGGYSTQSIYSYWNRSLDKSVYYTSGNIGIGTSITKSTFDVNGLSLMSGNVGIGTTFARNILDVQGGNIIGYPLITIINDTKNSTTQGGASSATTWNIRTLNTIIVDYIKVSLSSNTFTLLPGTYRIEVSAPAYNVGIHRIRLYNVTSSIVENYGTSEVSSGTDTTQTRSIINNIISITDTYTYRIEHYTELSNGTNGLGKASSITSVSEIYTLLTLTKYA